MATMDECFAELRGFPVLETERLVLREIRDDDAAAAHEMFTDAEVMRYVGKAPHADQERTRDFLKRNRDLFAAGEGVRWVLTRRGEDRFLGSCGHWRLMKEHRRSEIGYDLRAECWGQGLMSEALRAILGFGFARLGLHSVEAQIDPANGRSRRLLERQGFRQDGLLRENFYFAGQFTDTAVFTLLAREFEALEVARTAGFTEAEWEEYDREKVAEQDARGALKLAQREGFAEGHKAGQETTMNLMLRQAIFDLCEVLAIEITPERREHVARLDGPELLRWRDQLKRTRAWPLP